MPSETERRFNEALRVVGPDDLRWLLYHWHAGRWPLPVRLTWDNEHDTLLEVRSDGTTD